MLVGFSFFGIHRRRTPVCFANQYPEMFHSGSDEAHSRSKRRSSWGINLVTSSMEMFFPAKHW